MSKELCCCELFWCHSVCSCDGSHDVDAAPTRMYRRDVGKLVGELSAKRSSPPRVSIVWPAVVVAIALHLCSNRQLSSLRKSVTATGLSHRSCTVALWVTSDGFDSWADVLWSVFGVFSPVCFELSVPVQVIAWKAWMLTRPDILRPEVRGGGQDQRARPEVGGQGREQAQIVCKNRMVIPKHSSTMRWIKSESDRAFHWIHPRWPRLSEFPVATAI